MTVSLEGDHDGVFALVMRKKALSVASLSSVNIPFSFCPQLIHDHPASIILTCADMDISWTFPLRGVAEGSAPATKHTRIITCAARSQWKDVLHVTLDGLVQGPLPKPETFFLGVECAPENDKFLKSALSLTLAQSTLVDGSKPLQVQAIFEPLKPCAFEAFLVVNKASGGRWKFPLRVEATAPQVDDVIMIEASINTTSSIAFTMTNQFERPDDFTAYLSPESPVEFKVYPKKGVLEPLGSENETRFLISFTPKEYGKMLVGKLVIETADVQWTYELRGSHPRYSAPQVNSTLDTMLSPSVRSRLQQAKSKHVNYVSANMKTLKR